MDPEADQDPLASLLEAQAAAEPFALAPEMMIVAVGLVILWIATSVLWFFLPFAVFGIKGRLDRLISEVRRQNDLLGRAGGGDTQRRRDPVL